MTGVGLPAWVGIFTVVGTVVIWVVVKGYKVIQAMVHIAELIVGKPAVGKTEAVPGLAARLANIEYELHTNSGGSLRDLVASTLNLAKANADSVQAAKEVAETAVGKAGENARLLQETEEKAKRERLRMQQALDSLMKALDGFAQEAHAREVGTLRALKAAGFPITEIVEEEL